MAETLKMKLAQRVIDCIRRMEQDPGLDRAKCETKLRNLGMSPGNAQRLLDTSKDVQLGRLEEVAKLLGMRPADLLADSPDRPISPGDAPAQDLPAALPVVLGSLPGLPAYTAKKVLSALEAATEPRAPLEKIERDLLQWLTEDRGSAAPPPAEPAKRQA
jgi:DNA-binding Xre family transcriptional regulator